MNLLLHSYKHAISSLITRLILKTQNIVVKNFISQLHLWVFSIKSSRIQISPPQLLNYYPKKKTPTKNSYQKRKKKSVRNSINLIFFDGKNSRILIVYDHRYIRIRCPLSIHWRSETHI